jgi:streptogramin lyase
LLAPGAFLPAWAANPPTISAITYTAPTGASLNYPYGVTSNNAGKLYVSNSGDNVVSTITGTTTATFAGSYEGFGESGDGGPATAATLFSPGGVALDAAGNVYIADTQDNVVRKVDTSGVITLFAGNGTEGYSGDGGPATAAELDNPQSVAVDASGDVFIADSYNNVIREVTPAGTISTLSPATAPATTPATTALRRRQN